MVPLDINGLSCVSVPSDNNKLQSEEKIEKNENSGIGTVFVLMG